MARKTIVEEVQHHAEEKLRERVEEFEGKIAVFAHELKESNEHREDLSERNKGLMAEIAALKLGLAADSDSKAEHIANKGTI